MKQRGLPTITLNHIHFCTYSITFKLYGLININNCLFDSYYYTNVYFFRSYYEPAPTEENVRSFQSYVTNKAMRLYKSQIDSLWLRFFDTARKVTIFDSKIPDLSIFMEPEQVSALSLLMLEIFFLQSQISISRGKEKSFLFINLFSGNIYDLSVSTSEYFNGKVGLHVENVTWVNKNESFFDIRYVISVNIISSQLIAECDACSPMIFYGLNIQKNSLEYYFRNDVTNLKFDLPIVLLHETIFKLHTKVQDRISTEKVKVILHNSTFIIKRSMYIDTSVFIVSNTLVLCPTAQKAKRIKRLNHIFYECYSACQKSTEYSLQTGSLQISEPNDAAIIQFSTAQLSLVEYLPSCLSCPVGARCADVIRALPEYWGYKTQKEVVSMIRCPDGYCCQGNDTCKGIDSCNTGRIGTLCGRCEQNLTEALFTPKCFSTESCRSGLVIVILISAVIIYAVALLSFSTIKDMIIKLTKRIYTWCKGRSQHEKVNEKGTNEKLSKKDEATDDSGMKYIQLLFYYVQDSKLFTVQLPDIGGKTENIVIKFLQFSPRILEAYVQATELCFIFSTAITKVVLQFSFGFLVIAFLCVVYLVQLILSHCVQKLAFDQLQMKLVQAFTLAVLFSYQNAVMGAFILVQCVVIKDQAILFVQADIQCYTLWQIGIIIYVCTCIVPMFFVIAHVPFSVKERRMSIHTFILSCLFPLPVMLVHCVAWYRKKKIVTLGPLEKSGFETLEMVEIQSAETTQDSTREHLGKVSLASEELTGSENLQSTAAIKSSAEVKEGINVATKVPETSCSYTSLINGSEKLEYQSRDEGSMEGKTIITAPAFDIITDELGNKEDNSEQNAVTDEDVDSVDKTECCEQITDEQKKEKTLDENKVDKINSCEEMIEDSLLKHYKCLSLFRVRFTWLGVHKIYRVILVVCRTFIMDPVTRLYVMSVIVIMMTALNAFIKPYKEQMANKTATFSYIATLFIAIINIGKSHLVNYGCDTNCDHRVTIVRYMDIAEDILLLYVPLVAMGLWVLHTGLQKCLKKCKKQNI